MSFETLLTLFYAILYVSGIIGISWLCAYHFYQKVSENVKDLLDDLYCNFEDVVPLNEEVEIIAGEFEKKEDGTSSLKCVITKK